MLTLLNFDYALKTQNCVYGAYYKDVTSSATSNQANTTHGDASLHVLHTSKRTVFYAETKSSLGLVGVSICISVTISGSF